MNVDAINVLKDDITMCLKDPTLTTNVQECLAGCLELAVSAINMRMFLEKIQKEGYIYGD